MNNKLIFGADPTQNIVNVTMKDDQVYLYSQDEKGNVKLDQFPYTPWVLSHEKIKSTSEQLKGNQYWKFLTSTTCDKFNKLQETYQRDLWLPRNIVETFLLCEGTTYYKGLKVPDVSVLSFDIETSGLVTDDTSTVYLISNTFRKNGQVIEKLFNFDEYPTQEAMIQSWCKWVRHMDPSILCGHNILSYDLPYLEHCNHATLKLGRDDSAAQFASKTSKFRKDGSQQYDYHNVIVTGRDIVDTFFLSMKYDIAREFPSYGLKPIVKHLGLEKEGRSFIDASKIREYYKNRDQDPDTWNKVKQYAIEDSDDALKLYDLMVPAYFYLAQSVPKTMQQMINEASGAQLDSLMIRSYLQDGYSQPRTSQSVEFEGAISMGVPGIYEHVKKADVASLYPSIMLEHNIHDPKKDPENHMIQMLKYFREERLANKKKAKETGEKYYDDMQNAQKICINSLYGFLGAGFLLYNFPAGAAEVTRQGRKVLLKGVEWATGHTLERVVKDITNEGKENEEISYEWVLGSRVCEGLGYTIVNVDTDSFSITNGNLINEDEFFKELKELNSLYPDLIKWEPDGIYEKVIVIRAKNYILLRDGKIKIKGSAITDQKKEPALAEMLERMVSALLEDEKTALPILYKSYIKEAMNIKDIKRWCVKKTITKSVLKPARLTERKILNAMEEIIDLDIQSQFQEGDKIWLYNAIIGQIQDEAKGKKIFYKDGRPKMIDNCILRDYRVFDGEYDNIHYVNRVHDTVNILSNVLDMTQFIDYSKKSNLNQLEVLTNERKYGNIDRSDSAIHTS